MKSLLSKLLGKEKCLYEEIVLHRFGVLDAHTTSFNQCKDVGHHEYEYTVKMYCSNRLDHNGWLIDNRMINQAMKEAMATVDSCERMCLHFADILEPLIRSHGVKLYKLYVYINPIVIGEVFKDHAAFEVLRVYSKRKGVLS